MRPRASRLLLPLTVAGALLVSTMAAATAGSYTLDMRLNDSRIIESSGLARSTYARDTLFTHNDSGDSARVFAIDPSGQTQAVLTLAGVTARDDEDISTGLNHTLWLADIGDNGRRHDDYRVYAFNEPIQLSSQTVRATTYRLAYPDGSHNAEGMMINPVTGRLYVVTKAASGAGIYAAPQPLSATDVNRMTRVASAPSHIKAASFSPDGSSFVLSGRDRVYVYRSIGGAPALLPAPPFRGSESVEVSRSGQTFFIGREGSHSPVYEMPMP